MKPESKNYTHLFGIAGFLPQLLENHFTVYQCLDVFEHVYLPDYGLERGEYIDAFLENVDWGISSERYDSAKQTKSAVAMVL